MVVYPIDASVNTKITILNSFLDLWINFKVSDYFYNYCILGFGCKISNRSINQPKFNKMFSYF